jgi:hypothetical protein
MSRRLMPDPQVARQRYGVHPRTLKRWDKKPELNFPGPIEINNRKYRDVDRLDAWDRDNSRQVASMPDRSDNGTTESKRAPP